MVQNQLIHQFVFIKLNDLYLPNIIIDTYQSKITQSYYQQTKTKKQKPNMSI